MGVHDAVRATRAKPQPVWRGPRSLPRDALDEKTCATSRRGLRRSALRPRVLLPFGLLLLAAPAAAAGPAVEPIAVVYGPAPGTTLNGPLGIAVDSSRREVLVANTGNHRIEIYDFKGRPRARFVHRVRGRDGTWVNGLPAQLLLDAARRTLVVDQLATYVDVLDFRGRPVARLDLAAPGAGCPAANAVGAVAVLPSGEILVAAAGDSGRVYRFDRRYRPLGCWGEPGKSRGQLSAIVAMAALPDGRCVVVSGTAPVVVQIFRATGEWVCGFGAHEIGEGNFSAPSGVAATADGRIWVSDQLRQTVQVFDSAGGYLGAVGGQGAAPGEFLYPSALASDGREYLAVSERVGNRFQLLGIR